MYSNFEKRSLANFILGQVTATIQAGAEASPAGFSFKWSILYRRRSRGSLRSTRPRAPFRGLGFQVALLAPLRRGFLLRQDSRPIFPQPFRAPFWTCFLASNPRALLKSGQGGGG